MKEKEAKSKGVEVKIRDPQQLFEEYDLSVLKRTNKYQMPEPSNTETPFVQNVVSFARMVENTETVELDLKAIAVKVNGCRYNKKRFPAAIMRMTKPKSTILVFHSGRMIIIGSESEEDAKRAAKQSVHNINKSLMLKLKMKDFRVTNIVANADLGWKIDIGRLCEARCVIRNPDFPGVVYKNISSVKSTLIFASGKVVFTGAQNKHSIDKAFEQLKVKMVQFRVNN